MLDINMATNTHKPLFVVPLLSSEINHLICFATIQSQFAKGCNVVIVAPDSPQSGMGHAITINKPLRLDKVDLQPIMKAGNAAALLSIV